MNVSCTNGLISFVGPDGVRHLSAEQIYSIWFEGQAANQSLPVLPGDLERTGLEFSDSPASPAIVIDCTVGPRGEPIIRCQLAGATGSSTVAVTPPADYVIIGRSWHPLPVGTTADYDALLASLNIGSNPLTVGQYLDLVVKAEAFRVIDRAAPILSASSLASYLESPAPPGLHATLYPYQQIGIAWLGFMARHGVGCILADEMGLGKTLQVIGVLVGEVEEARRPNLVVCPATLLENWRREINRFAPSIRVLVHAGQRRTGSVAQLDENDVVVTSYETLAGDISIFSQIRWNVVAADEAQNLRNPAARRTLRAKQIQRRTTIAVTGTPLENKLSDLWSITDLVLPGYLGALREFELSHPDTEFGARSVEPLISAVMLRRRIRDVAQDLPPRIDVPVPLLMDQVSANAYEEIRTEIALHFPQNPDLVAIMRLRLFCAHPWAAEKLLDEHDPAACSPKLERCLEIIEEVALTGAKALIFASFNEVADLIESTLVARLRIPVGKINGNVPISQRQQIVDEFSSIAGPAVLVLNPKAAGTGLNITAASHVIHYNLEWNPAVEDQASARAHRRGQVLPVTVHRMFYANTVEEVIDERIQRKRKLAEYAVVGSAGNADDLADVVQALQRSPISK